MCGYMMGSPTSERAQWRTRIPSAERDHSPGDLATREVSVYLLQVAEVTHQERLWRRWSFSDDYRSHLDRRFSHRRFSIATTFPRDSNDVYEEQTRLSSTKGVPWIDLPPAEDTFVCTGKTGGSLHTTMTFNTVESMLITPTPSSQHGLREMTMIISRFSCRFVPSSIDIVSLLNDYRSAYSLVSPKICESMASPSLWVVPSWPEISIDAHSRPMILLHSLTCVGEDDSMYSPMSSKSIISASPSLHPPASSSSLSILNSSSSSSACLLVYMYKHQLRSARGKDDADLGRMISVTEFVWRWLATCCGIVFATIAIPGFLRLQGRYQLRWPFRIVSLQTWSERKKRSSHQQWFILYLRRHSSLCFHPLIPFESVVSLQSRSGIDPFR